MTNKLITKVEQYTKTDNGWYKSIELFGKSIEIRNIHDTINIQVVDGNSYTDEDVPDAVIIDLLTAKGYKVKKCK